MESETLCLSFIKYGLRVSVTEMQCWGGEAGVVGGAGGEAAESLRFTVSCCSSLTPSRGGAIRLRQCYFTQNSPFDTV